MTPPHQYRAHDEASLPAYLATLPAVAARLGEPAGWHVGDAYPQDLFTAGVEAAARIRARLPNPTESGYGE